MQPIVRVSGSERGDRRENTMLARFGGYWVQQKGGGWPGDTKDTQAGDDLRPRRFFAPLSRSDDGRLLALTAHEL